MVFGILVTLGDLSMLRLITKSTNLCILTALLMVDWMELIVFRRKTKSDMLVNFKYMSVYECFQTVFYKIFHEPFFNYRRIVRHHCSSKLVCGVFLEN